MPDDKEAISREIADEEEALRALRTGRASIGGAEITNTASKGEATLAKEIADLKSKLAKASDNAHRT